MTDRCDGVRATCENRVAPSGIVCDASLVPHLTCNGASTACGARTSSGACENPGDPPPTEAPVLLAVAGTAVVDLAWTPVNGALGYQINRVGGFGPVAIAVGATTSFIDTGLTNGVLYTYTIVATNSAGSGPVSQARAVTPIGAPVLAVVVDSGRVTLSWAAVVGATGFKVFRDGVFVDTTSTTSWSFAGLPNGQSVALSAQATNASGASSPASISAIPLAAPVVAPTPECAAVTLSWSPVAGAVGYGVHVNGSLVASSAALTARPSLTPGVASTLQIAALNSLGQLAGRTTIAVTPFCPPALTNVIPRDGGVTLSWSSVPNATAYSVKRQQGSTFTPIATTTSTTTSLTALTNGVASSFAVTATVGGFEGVASTAVTATPFVAPSLVVATASTRQITLTWPPAAGASSYVVGRATSGAGPFADVSPAVFDTSYTDSFLPPNVTYYYVVWSVSGGARAASPVTSATALSFDCSLCACGCSGSACTPCDDGGGSCFVAGTRVQMADGTERPIERIVAGDRVASFDESTGERVSGVVRQTFVHPNTPGLVSLDGGFVVTTPEHPFFANGQWVPAGRLGAGDSLAAIDEGSWPARLQLARQSLPSTFMWCARVARHVTRASARAKQNRSNDVALRLACGVLRGRAFAPGALPDLTLETHDDSHAFAFRFTHRPHHRRLRQE